MNDSWHIPRASLGGSTSGSSNGSSKSHSNPPTVTRYSSHLRQEGHANFAYIHDEKPSRKPRGSKRDFLHNHHYDLKANVVSNRDGIAGSGLKRGSRSSQGSTDSTNSSHSASSGSMLLTAANLERFVAIHNQQQKSGGYLTRTDPRNRENYSTNLAISTNPDQVDSPAEKRDTIIGIDPNLQFVKTKDVDAVSIASSTHFTVVNGIGGPQKPIKEGICSRGHQITVLILTMSMFFLIGIMAMVYLLEMRAREMPQ